MTVYFRRSCVKVSTTPSDSARETFASPASTLHVTSRKVFPSVPRAPYWSSVFAPLPVHIDGREEDDVGVLGDVFLVAEPEARDAVLGHQVHVVVHVSPFVVRGDEVFLGREERAVSDVADQQVPALGVGVQRIFPAHGVVDVPVRGAAGVRPVDVAVQLSVGFGQGLFAQFFELWVVGHEFRVVVRFLVEVKAVVLALVLASFFPAVTVAGKDAGSVSASIGRAVSAGVSTVFASTIATGDAGPTAWICPVLPPLAPSLCAR